MILEVGRAFTAIDDSNQQLVSAKMHVLYT